VRENKQNKQERCSPYCLLWRRSCLLV